MLTETLEYLGIAFISSVLLIIMSKIILQSLIRRPADYYDAEELRQEELMLNAGGISLASEHETTPEGEIMEETHLEPHLGAFVAAEPEPIFAEIPQSVIESIEPAHIHEEIQDNEPEPEPIPEAKEDEVIIIEKAEEVVPQQPAVAEEKPKNITYKIKWGDTLWDIADTYYKNPWRYKYIARYNGIRNPDFIISGTLITIPAE